MSYPVYPHLLSPYKVGNLTFRNRIMAAPTGIHALQAGEPYPNEATIATFANRARGGAAVVCIPTYFEYHGDSAIFWDMSVRNHQHYLAAATEAIRFHGAIASMEVSSALADPRYTASAGIRGPGGIVSEEMSADQIERITDEFAENCFIGQRAGFEMCHIHLAYGSPVGGTFLSFATNHRTDRFGGSIENMANYPILAADKIKARCGQDFLVEIRISGEEPQYPNGMTPADWVEMSRYLEGHVDLLMVHAPKKEYAHPSEFYPDAPYVPAAEQIRKGGCRIPVVAIGGIQAPDQAEKILAEGKADLIGMARGLIADPDLPRKAYEGRGEDVVPCIRCIRCHDSACRDHKTYVCSVNPRIGVEHRLPILERPAAKPKRIAVIGGGPSGMESALELAKRGHHITLYEKSASLGGLLNQASFPKFKRDLRRFRDYLVRQIEASPVTVRLETEATPECIAEEGFDQIIAAIGSQPSMPPIPGIDSGHVLRGIDIFGREHTLGQNIVVIGGGQIGCEIALHLARLGKKVSILEATDTLAPNATVVYRDDLLEAMSKEDNIQTFLRCTCTEIADAVHCHDRAGQPFSLPADHVLISTGMRPRTEEAYAFTACAARLQLVGSCLKDGNVEHAMRTAFGVACTL